jgi:hypothetical protein
MGLIVYNSFATTSATISSFVCTSALVSSLSFVSATGTSFGCTSATVSSLAGTSATISGLVCVTATMGAVFVTSTDNGLLVGEWVDRPSPMSAANHIGGDLFVGNASANLARLRLSSNQNAGLVQYNQYYNGTDKIAFVTSKPRWEIRLGNIATYNEGIHFQSAEANATTEVVRIASFNTTGLSCPVISCNTLSGTSATVSSLSFVSAIGDSFVATSVTISALVVQPVSVGTAVGAYLKIGSSVTAATAALEVLGDMAYIRLNDQANGAVGGFGTTSTAGGKGPQGAWSGTIGSTNAYTLRTNNVPRATIFASGQVGIGVGAITAITPFMQIAGDLIVGGTTAAYLAVSSVGYPTMIGTVAWEDVRVPGYAFGKNVSSPSLVSVGSSGGLLVNGFSGAALNQVYFNIQLPHSYKLASDIYPHVHWMATTTVTGDVEWKLEYSWTNINEATVANNTITVLTSAAGTAYYQKLASFAAITGTGRDISSNLLCRFYRDGSGLDTYSDIAGVLDFDVHIQQDTLGSTAELSK